MSHFLFSIEIRNGQGRLSFGVFAISPEEMSDPFCRKVHKEILDTAEARLVVSEQPGEAPPLGAELVSHPGRRLVVDMVVMAPGVSRTTTGPAFSGNIFETIITGHRSEARA